MQLDNVLPRGMRRIYELEALERRFFLSAGFLDNSFGRDGLVVDSRVSDVTQVLLQPDGKILVGGIAGKNEYFVARYNADGSWDETFSDDGLFEAGTQRPFQEMVLQPDGKILVVTDHSLARLNSDGSIDSDFGDNGVVVPRNWLDAVLVQRSGKIVLSLASGWLSRLTRLNADGSPDLSFGERGGAAVYWGSVEEMAEQPDGKIVVEEFPSDYDEPDDYYNNYYVEKFSADGESEDFALDVPTGDSDVQRMVLTDEGEIVILTTTGWDPMKLFRYDGQGRAEAGFGNQGMRVKVPLDPFESDMTLGRNGKMILFSAQPDLLVARFNADGSLDNTFGSDGIARPAIGAFENVMAVEDGAGGIILVGSFTDNDGSYALRMARLTSDSDPTPREATPAKTTRERVMPDVFIIDPNMQIDSQADSEASDDAPFFADDQIDPLDENDVIIWD